MSILRVEQLTKVYGSSKNSVTVLKQVKFSVAAGEFVSIMGPSGSGKSTLMHLMGGLDRPTGGEVWLNDTALSTLNEKALARLRRKQVGFIFQFFNLVPVLSARENVAMPLILDGVSRKEALQKADDVLKVVKLNGLEDRRPAELSGGQQQRVAIARALIIKPTLILGDEPTGALDTHTSEEIVRLLRYAADKLQRTVIIVTHDPRIAAHSDRIVYIKDGEVVDDNRLGSTPATADSIRQRISLLGAE